MSIVKNQSININNIINNRNNNNNELYIEHFEFIQIRTYINDIILNNKIDNIFLTVINKNNIINNNYNSYKYSTENIK